MNTTQNRTVIVALCLCVSLLYAADTPETKPASPEKKYPERPVLNYLDMGDAAPDFSLPGVDGKTYKLSDFAASEVLVVIFTCNHCPTSILYEDTIIKLAKDYQSKGVALVAISPNDPGALRPDEVAGSAFGDSFEEMKIYAKERKFNFPYLYDGKTQKATIAYGAQRTPHVFVFDKKRKLCYSGAVTRTPYNVGSHPYTKLAIDSLLAGQEVMVKSSRSMGCSVKWGWKRERVDAFTNEWNKRPVKLDDINADGLKKLVEYDQEYGKLRMICVWSLKDKTYQSGFGKLINLRRIYERLPLDLITVNCDPASDRKKVFKFLNDNHAAMPVPPMYGSPQPQKKVKGNRIFTPGDRAELMKALGQKKVTAPPVILMLAPGGDVLYTQTGKLDVLALRKQLARFLSRR